MTENIFFKSTVSDIFDEKNILQKNTPLTSLPMVGSKKKPPSWIDIIEQIYDEFILYMHKM
jgi:hypothetical protein